MARVFIFLVLERRGQRVAFALMCVVIIMTMIVVMVAMSVIVIMAVPVIMRMIVAAVMIMVVMMIVRMRAIHAPQHPPREHEHHDAGDEA